MDGYYTPTLIGGIGNRLFQIASIYGLSKRHNKKFAIHIENICGNPHSTTDYSRFYKDFISTLPITYFKKYETNMNFCKYIEYPIYKDNILFHGYFQTEKYFKEFREEILRLFSPTEDEIKYINDKFKPHDAAFIHVRLGDYYNNDLFYVNLKKYYPVAIQLLRDAGCSRFIVVTQDIDLCKKEYPWMIDDSYEYLRTLDDIPDSSSEELISLFLMKMCGMGGICGNSTFSWWGGWLNESPMKVITFPGKWLNCNWYQKDIYHEDAIVVPL